MSIYAAFELERQLGRDELVGEVRAADLDTLCTSGTRDADTRTNEFFKYGALYRRTHTSMPKLQNLYQERHGCNSQPLGMWPPHSIWALWCQVLDSTDTAHALSCNQDRASTLFGSQFLRTSTCCGRTKLTSVHLGSTTTVSSKGWPFFVTLALSSVNATVTRFHALPITADNQVIACIHTILSLWPEQQGR
ncbi:hypothetical protein PISMIDRAFT_675185 [Pisolithus microcarpus 441]|uniref:Uncharacterized protein n=1 Tax=Pisolithus microcarpus 441 TaxID=765257 RepID=A0A0C9ZYJ4_9AGAM|nr:hypothetical protein PISMIDRAFT_675185 [Pisolithus microcarpus 441]